MASSNGVAERAVQTVKGWPDGAELACFLLTNRTTTVAGGKSPTNGPARAKVRRQIADESSEGTQEGQFPSAGCCVDQGLHEEGARIGEGHYGAVRWTGCEAERAANQEAS